MALPVAVIGELLGWVPESATWVGIVAGPLVLTGYLTGSIPYDYLLSRRRLRRQLADPARPRSRGDARNADPAALPGAVLAGLAGLVVATIAWDVAFAAAPSSLLVSSVGVYSDQILGAWVSVALWTGAAFVAGHAAPLWTRFRGGSGVAPAVALAFVYCPTVLAVAVAVFALAFALTRDVATSIVTASPAAVTFEYVAWVTDVQDGWGVVNGPELSLWTTVVAGILLARHGGVAARRSAGAPAGQ